MRRSGIMGYRCPKPIFDSWQKLFLGVGYVIEKLPEERRYGVAHAPSGVNRYWSIESAELSAKVTIGYPEPFGLPGYHLFVRWSASGRELAAAIERMLIASRRTRRRCAP